MSNDRISNHLLSSHVALVPDVITDDQMASPGKLVKTIEKNKTMLPTWAVWLGLAVCLGVFLFAWNMPSAATVDESIVSSQSVPTPIEDVQLGWRVVGENPLGQETWDEEPNEQNWRKVVLNLDSEAGDLIEISYLRPNAWFEKWRAEVGSTIDLSLSERGKSGIAIVMSIEACPEIQSGSGPVVTGLYRHLCKAAELVRLTFDGGVEPIVGTYNHPFWSETRGEFINAAELQPGERLRCTDDEIILVKAVEAVEGVEPVFNLETHNHHIYAVGNAGILVHNMHGADVGADGEVVRRFDSKSNTKNLKKNGVQINPDKGNGIPTTTTNIDPVNPDKIIQLTGAKNADTFADIDISNLPVVRTTTNNGNIEIRITADIEPTRVIGIGRVRKNKLSTED